MDKNKYIEPENYFEGYNDSIKDLKNNPKVIEFDKLCYELFEHQEAGRRFVEMVTERYLIPTIVQKGPTYQIDILWQEGFKDAFRMIISSVKSHAQRIKSETT
jgi:hypothetical protein